MLTPRFKINKTDRIYLTEDFLCNGYWLIAHKNPSYLWKIEKIVSPILQLKCGAYTLGINKPMTDTKTPDMATIIPKREGYKVLKPTPISANFKNELNIDAFVYETQDESLKIGVNTDYVELLSLGTCHAKDKSSPILVLSDESLNGDLIAVVMPYKI